jgi:sterol 3beta-glucosyltransferase
MRYSLLTVGSRGDTQPYLALALALKARGHQVRFCGPSNFGPLAQGLGVEFVALPWDTQLALDEEGLRQRLLAGDVVGFFRRVQQRAWDLRQGLWQAWEQATADADVLIPGSTAEDAALLLGQARGQKVLLNELMPFAPRADRAPLVFGDRSFGPLNRPAHWLGRQAWWWVNRAGTAALAEHLGLPRPWNAPVLKALSAGAPVLGAYSPSLLPLPAGWDHERRPVLGPWRLSSAAAQSLPGDHQDAGFAAWLEDGVPPVYLGFGSMPADASLDLLELAGDVAEILETRVVLGAGWSKVAPAADCDLPEGVAIVGDCDHDWLFQRCSAVVHHGGAGTTHAAAASGLPQVVCPFFADQPFWAQAVRNAGAGVILPFQRLDSEPLAQALLQVMASGAEGAARLALAMQAEPGAAGAAAWIERQGA